MESAIFDDDNRLYKLYENIASMGYLYRPVPFYAALSCNNTFNKAQTHAQLRDEISFAPLMHDPNLECSSGIRADDRRCRERSFFQPALANVTDKYMYIWLKLRT